MPRQLTAEDARQSLRDHVAAKGGELREKYGPRVAWSDLEKILTDRALVRYPTEIVFDAAPLQPGELAYAQPLGEHPAAGFRISVHPQFEAVPDDALSVVLYQLTAVNYGDFAPSADAESFGAAALGIEPEAYYQRLCALADSLAAPAA